MQSVYERFYVTRLTELSVNRFKWNNLPVSVDPRFLEMTLLNNGLAVFFQDENMAAGIGEDGAYMALPATPAGQHNPTNNPTKFQINAVNYPNKKQLSARECVPIWANVTRTSDRDLVDIYAHRLASLDMTLDINAMNARRTKTVVADENTRLSGANAARLIEEGAPVVYTNTPLESMISVVDFAVDPKSIETLHVYKVRLWNECMMLLGIQGANQDKKERLVADEVHANKEQVDLNEHNALATRQLAAEQINRKYGTNISVEFVTQENAFSAIDGG